MKTSLIVLFSIIFLLLYITYLIHKKIFYKMYRQGKIIAIYPKNDGQLAKRYIELECIHI